MLDASTETRVELDARAATFSTNTAKADESLSSVVYESDYDSSSDSLFETREL